jgi:hypothetical protein
VMFSLKLFFGAEHGRFRADVQPGPTCMFQTPFSRV